MTEDGVDAVAALLEAFPDAALVVDRSGRILAFNGLAERLFGFRRAEVVGASLDVLLPTAARDAHRVHVAAFAPGRARAMGDGALLRARRADGGEVPVEISLGPVRVAGVDAVAASVRDVSGRRDLEERLAAALADAARSRDALDDLLRQLPDAVARLAPDGRVRFSNGRFPEPAPAGAPWPASPPGSLAARIHARLPEVARGAPVTAEEALSPDRVWTLRLWAVGDPPETLVLARDVTETRRLEAGLLASDRVASTGMLAATLAHEINNPLAALLATLDLADAPEGCSPDLLHEAWLAAERIRAITSDLLVFAPADGGPQADLHGALDSALRLADRALRARATVVRRYGVLPPVAMPPSRLGQVFLNLLVNAAQAIPPGGAHRNRVTVTTTCDRDRVHVAVADTGVGMDEAVRARLFSPFFTTKPPGEGTGLGLAICLRLVREAGGDLSVASEPGGGSTFTVSLPAALPIA